MQREALTDYLIMQRTLVEASMKAHMGSQTMCEIHKDGSVSGGLKYDEGRLVVLGDMLRWLREVDPFTDEAVRAYLAEQAARWGKLLARHTGAERPSMPWVAYSQGGADMCAALSNYCRA